MTEADTTSNSGAQEIMLREYDYYAAAFRQSEAFGEKRVTSFFTLAGLLSAGIGLIANKSDLKGILPLTAIAVLVLLCFGRVTVTRLIKRNLNSDGYKEGMRLVRAWFTDKCGPQIAEHMYHPPSEQIPARHVSILKGTGGWLETMLLTNSLLAGFGAYVIAALLNRGTCDSTWIHASLAVLVAGLFLWGQIWDAERQYEKGRS